MNVRETIPTPAILLSDLVNTSHSKKVEYRLKELTGVEKLKPWQATKTVRVIAPKNCQNMVIDLSKPNEPKVRYKIAKTTSNRHG